MKRLLVVVLLLLSLLGCGPEDRVVEGTLDKVTIEQPSLWGRHKDRTGFGRGQTVFTFADGRTLITPGSPDGFAYQEGKRVRITLGPVERGNRIKKLEILN